MSDLSPTELKRLLALHRSMGADGNEGEQAFKALRKLLDKHGKTWNDVLELAAAAEAAEVFGQEERQRQRAVTGAASRRHARAGGEVQRARAHAPRYRALHRSEAAREPRRRAVGAAYACLSWLHTFATARSSRGIEG